MSIYYTPSEPTNWTTEPDAVRAALDTLAAKLLSPVGAEDIEFTGADIGVILRAPNGTRWRLNLDGAEYTTEEVTS